MVDQYNVSYVIKQIQKYAGNREVVLFGKNEELLKSLKNNGIKAEKRFTRDIPSISEREEIYDAALLKGKASQIFVCCQNRASNSEKFLWECGFKKNMDYVVFEPESIVIQNIPEKKNENTYASSNENKTTMLTSMADIMYRIMMAMRYGGDLFDYLNDLGIDDFDMYVEGEAIRFLPVIFNCAKRMPINIYSAESKKMVVKCALSGKNTVMVMPLDSAPGNTCNRPIITFAHWNYFLYKRLESLNYKSISMGVLANYTLYKSVILTECGSYLRDKGVKCLYTKFPQANCIKNQSKLEKFLSDNSIYGITSKAVEYGLRLEEIVENTGGSLIFADGVYKYADATSINYNVVNGFRVTTDLPLNTDKKIWIFGSSVVGGFLADDAHTSSSGLQRKLNEYFGKDNRYSVVNASNYAANDVSIVVPFMKRLPIEEGDICIFNMEFPKELLEQYKEIVDMSKYFNRPHNYGEIFVDINHMNGKGYCLQGEVMFKLLQEGNYFESTSLAKYDVKCVKERTEINDGGDEKLREYVKLLLPYRKKVGAIVMNCNPFTLGHRFLIEESAKKVEQLFVFVVQEDKSFFSFQDRIELVKQGTADIENVIVLPSGEFMISEKTFAAYSNKANLQNEVIDASVDVEIFAKEIAPALGITVRFAGEEPLDNVTRQYNDTMKRILPRYGVAFEVIPRKEFNGAVISASRVRNLLSQKDFKGIAEIVPETTLKYLENRFK